MKNFDQFKNFKDISELIDIQYQKNIPICQQKTVTSEQVQFFRMAMICDSKDLDKPIATGNLIITKESWSINHRLANLAVDYDKKPLTPRSSVNQSFID